MMKLTLPWLAGILMGAGISVSCTTSEGKKDDPNIIIIMADDLGYGDFSCYGATKINTPIIDQLASEGIRFTDAYVPSSLCSPSRYSILTGRYSWRTRLVSGVLTSFAPPLIEEEEKTLAAMLKERGYYTACIGKWHLGFDWSLNDKAPEDAEESVFNAWGPEPQNYIDFSKTLTSGPIDRGFDYFYGIPGANDMLPSVIIENDRVTEPPSVPKVLNPKVLQAANWDIQRLDQEFTAKATQLIENHFKKKQEQPLFLYLPASAIHRPCLPTITDGESRAGLRGDMVIEFDRMVGEVLGSLEKQGELENSLIIVTSDNGPRPGDPLPLVNRFKNKVFGDEYDYYKPYFGDYEPKHHGHDGVNKGWLMYGHDPAGGLRGLKGDGWEGGLRVPFIVSWPGKINGGSVNSEIISTVDIYATVAEIIGVMLQEGEAEDSYSFLPNLMDVDAPPYRKSLILVEGSSGNLAVRQEGWKFIQGNRMLYESWKPEDLPITFQLPGAGLYNLGEDPGEQNNMVHLLPTLAGRMDSIIFSVITEPGSEGF
ncbi:MAG: arylsulfatase [Bacteroidales bacterium]